MKKKAKPVKAKCTQHVTKTHHFSALVFCQMKRPIVMSVLAAPAVVDDSGPDSNETVPPWRCLCISARSRSSDKAVGSMPAADRSLWIAEAK